MLSSPDAELVRRDARLPGLATLLDTEALGAALARALPGVERGAAQIVYVRYKPGTSCLAAYRLMTSSTELDVYAKTFAAGVALRAGRLVLHDGATAVWIFPNDRRLKVLPQLAAPAGRRRLHQKLVPGHADLWDARVGRLAYKPERRYVGRLAVDGVARAVVKAYTPSGFDAARRGAKAFAPRGALRLARLLGRSKRRGLLASEWLPGRLASEAMSDPGWDPAAASTIGAALAEVHLQECDTLACWTAEQEAAALFPLADALGTVVPRLARRAGVLAGKLAAGLAAVPAVSRPVHGDFYAKQVLLAGDCAAILDCDEAVHADPFTDLGNFIAHLEHSALRGDFSEKRVRPTAEALLEGYRSRTTGPDPAPLVLYTAVRLFRLASMPFRHREPDWPERTEAILARTESLLGSIAAPRAVGGRSHAAAATDDNSMPFLARALDPAEAASLLRRVPQLTRAGGEVRVLAARLVRHKLQRRCVIEYEVEVPRGGAPPERMTLLGKARARGLDEDRYHALEHLWATGFGPHSADGIGIPEPMGTVPELRMWLQRKVPGTCATRLLVEPGGVALAPRIAEAIHKLHQAGVPARRLHSLVAELGILHERLPRVALSRPTWTTRLERLLAACDRLAARIADTPARGIHRDFYADHVIADGPRLHLVDFDLYCQGDPALDVGNFLGHLVEQGLRRAGDPAALADREDALRERYLELAGSTRRFAVHAYTTLTLVRHVHLSTLFPERRPFTETLLDLCEERLGLARGAGAGVRDVRRKECVP